MSKDLKERLKETMQRRNVKVPQLSIETGIPKDRIYAWYRDNTNPKDQDSKKIEKWITGEIFISDDTSSKIDPAQANNNSIPLIGQTFETLVGIINKQADTIKSQQETIFFLTTKGGDVGGRTAVSG